MGLFKDLVEPAGLIVAFTIGSLINSHGLRRKFIKDEVADTGTPPLKGQIYLGNRQPTNTPDNTRFRGNLTSRFLLYFPFLLEIGYWFLTYWPYQLARAFTVSRIRHNPSVFALAEQHAIRILNLEQKLHIAIEAPFQDLLLTRYPSSMRVLAAIYHSHILLGVCFLVYAYTFFSRPTYQRIRRTIAIDNWLAFVVLTIYRCAPPRLLPYEYGFVDVLHPKRMKAQQLARLGSIAEGTDSSGSVWTNNSHQLTIAAMPSLHFGTSLLIGYTLYQYAPHKVIKLLAPLWPIAMLVTIVGTANHFLLDALVGAMVVSLGYRVNGVLLHFRPVEEWFFWLMRTERPRTAEKKTWDQPQQCADLRDELEAIKEGQMLV